MIIPRKITNKRSEKKSEPTVSMARPSGPSSSSPVGFLTPRPSDLNVAWASGLSFPIAACILSMDGRAQISAYSKKNASSQTHIAGASQQEGGRALADDDSTRFGTATKARASADVDVVVDVEEGPRASRGRRENRQKLRALTSSEWPSSSVNVSGADADPRTVGGACEGRFHMCSLLSRPWLCFVFQRSGRR